MNKDSPEAQNQEVMKRAMMAVVIMLNVLAYIVREDAPPATDTVAYLLLAMAAGSFLGGIIMSARARANDHLSIVAAALFELAALEVFVVVGMLSSIPIVYLHVTSIFALLGIYMVPTGNVSKG